MSWIKMRHNLDTDPDVIAIAAFLDSDVLSVIGRLWKLWSWADEHSIGGKIRASETLIDGLVSLPKFCQALREVGWLSGRHKTITLTNFDRHNSQTAKERALTAHRVAKTRNARPLHSEQPTVTRPLPEKRREDKKREEETRPKKEEAVAYGSEIGMSQAEVESWFDHFESNGWKVGGRTPMKDWKAAMRNGQRRSKDGTHQRSNAESRRNVGTANEGRSDQYRGVGKA
jgi:hypothetical protein